MRSNRSCVKVTSSEIIQWPHTSSAIPAAIALGTKLSVTSWIWVTDCTSETTNPTTSAVTSTGAASLAASTRASRPTSTTAAVSIAHPPTVYEPTSDVTTRPQPSTSTKSSSLNGSEIITGGSIIMPIDIKDA